MYRKWVVITVLALMSACAVSPEGRKQFIFMPESQMVTMGVQSFHQTLKETPKLNDRRINEYVQCVANALTALPQVKQGSPDWEVVVFDTPTVNAFALPGGKIGVYKGLLGVAETPGQLAAVMGHEVGHVLAHHGNERVSQNFAIGQTLAILDNWMDAKNTANRKTVMTALGLGSQFGVLLPFSRLHESEADSIGLTLMAEAGFDPRESVKLWQNMGKDGGKAPPEFMSTHPSHDTRISELNAKMPGALAKFQQARKRGVNPGCRAVKP